MSLFGDEPEEPVVAAKSRLSLFDDEPSPAPGSKSSLFADEEPGASPWGIPTPKKAARGELIKSLLPASDVPDSYIDTFDDVVKGADNVGGKISVNGIAKVLSAANLGADDQSRVVSVITSGGQLRDFSRNEFNVLLALIGLAQEHEDITLDGVDERKRSKCIFADEIHSGRADNIADLPTPKLPSLNTSPSTFPGIEELAAKPPQRPATPPALQAPTPAPISVPSSNQKPRAPHKNSMEFPEADPWGSPAMHRGHNHEASPPKSNGAPRTANNSGHEPVRTTSNFTTASTAGSNGTSNRPSQESRASAVSGAWGPYDGNANASFSNSVDSTLGGEGFDGEGGDGDRLGPTAPTRTFGAGGTIPSGGPEENVMITLLPEKEGMFMFQHHNYQVTSPRRGSQVVRRYSDFVWLLDCLHKRYPFRQLPLLPPKRVGGEFLL
jgi:sorting nexin-8